MPLLRSPRVAAAGVWMAGLLAVVATTPPAASGEPRANRAQEAQTAMVTAPGSFTGYGFDSCAAPPQHVMDAWRTSSPYSAVGIYIGGSNRLCDQIELTSDWVRTQSARGWHLLPVQVGPQASCSGYGDVMSPDRATAEAQGRAEAVQAVANARALAIGKKSTIYLDIEDYDVSDTPCRQAVLAHVSGWTQQLHALDYRSGVYSNVAATIHSLDYADTVSPGSYVMPDDIWYAWANGRANSDIDARWVRPTSWAAHQRIHQYELDSLKTFGQLSAIVDVNWVDVGRGSTAAPGKAMCGGVDIDLRRFPRLRPGLRGPAVETAQCLLRRHHFGQLQITGRFERQTARAVRVAQRALGLADSGKVDRQTWIALLSRGGKPLLKVGSTGEPVRRAQRALTAALGRRVEVSGVFSKRTSASVLQYQQREALNATGNLDLEVWASLMAGR